MLRQQGSPKLLSFAVDKFSSACAEDGNSTVDIVYQQYYCAIP